ncbi:hypothetical protein DFH28DRAFT_970776 [Melampsora americana]|nr:hypothetical protein DFH28DRAFT_970776 [Melampsora americana]
MMMTRSVYTFAFTCALSLLQAGGLPDIENLGIKTTFKPSSCPITSQKGDKLAMLYVGRLASNGVRFDATEDPRKPFKFNLGAGEVIKGWDQGLLNMCEGENRTLTIPSALAYGKHGAGAEIPPDSTLVFDVQLLKILNRKPPVPEAKVGIEILREGWEGCSIAAETGDKVALLYTGKLASNDAQFDSALDPSKPIEFVLGSHQVIKGWEQGILGMCIGEKRRLNIPSVLGYAEFGNDLATPEIPPDADLIFDVELLDVRNRPSGVHIRTLWIKTWAIYQTVLGLLEDAIVFV